MLAQGIHHHRRQRYGSLSRLRFRASDLAEAVSALAHMQFAALEVDVVPAQPAQFGGTQAGEDRGQQEWPDRAASVERG